MSFAPCQHDLTRRDIESRGEAALTQAVGLGLAVSVVTLFILLVASVRTGRAVGSSPSPGGPPPSKPLHDVVSINLTGRQFWWEIEYEDAVPSRRVTRRTRSTFRSDVRLC